ncbi:hypothetical protein [Croceitalea rosinachiae]|uniref:MG2 domain-containing protein n=1 Tax=Croceitalea rosinachiae TaxID=3075596 RepID=A0ABU3ACV2_9FLAO|nr:hypothetical protein [Croceitalea sp. F388]MDT0607743.1 hypothetical protein [Croceitalea sp. F388]
MKNLTTLLLLITTCSFGQMASQNALANIPQESIYIHHNASLLFSGERLAYKMYCLNNSDRALSAISKMAYVSLVANDGTIVFNHKVRLQNGEGYGDFFVPTSVATGSYKLLGYSEWMKNGKTADFFQSDVRIINPYQPIPEPYLEKIVVKDSLDTIASIKTPKEILVDKKLTNITSPFVTMTVEKSAAEKRDKVGLKISGLTESAKKGTYSLSVRHNGNIESPKNNSLNDFFTGFLKKGTTGESQKNGINHLPELRGEIISGRVINKEKNIAEAGKKVSLSLPGKDYLLKVTTTSSDGRFYFNFDRAYDNLSAVVQLLDEDWDTYQVEIDKPNLDFGQFVFNDFKISKELEEDILRRSVQNQIENAYVSVRSDSIVPAKHAAPFYRDLETVYVLDDYTRFNSIQETIIEIVDQVSIKNLGNGKRVFQVRPPEGLADSGVLPMVFVDGLFLKEHENVMDFSAKKLKSISFSRNKYLLGTAVFQGIISFETLEDDFVDTFYAPHIQKIDLFKPEPQKEYFAQHYGSDEQSDRIPDFRHQLLWIPKLFLDADAQIDIYTSDVPGDCEIVLEGFTADGKPVFIRNWIKVE